MTRARYALLGVSSLLSIYNLIHFPGLPSYIFLAINVVLLILELTIISRYKPYGTIVDENNRLLDRVIVRLLLIGGNNQETLIDTSITDAIGRYKFVVSQPGKYRIEARRFDSRHLRSDMINIKKPNGGNINLKLRQNL